MKLQTRHREDLTLNITPLIDVVFLLLIFFMVSTTFNENSELLIRLPEASLEEPPQFDLDTIQVAVSADNVIHIQGRKLPDARLQTVEEAIYQARADMDLEQPPHLIINADADARHQAVVTVMDAAQRLDLGNIGIAYSSLEEESP